jgi:hypothetical protein
MTTPQQPDLSAGADTSGPVPEDNRPGHHPEMEQDKPIRPPTLPPRHRRFAFRQDMPVAAGSRLFGVTPDRAYVEVDDDNFKIRFGPWSLVTPMDNIVDAERTGPYRWWKVAGPPHLSFKDRGITFATTAAEGVCVRFRNPVPAVLPWSFLRHPGATVTVEDANDLVRFVNQKSQATSDERAT